MELLAPLPAGVLRGPWPGGTLHVRGNADTPGGGHPGTPGGLVVVLSLQRVLVCWMAPKEQSKVPCLQKAARWHSLLGF